MVRGTAALALLTAVLALSCADSPADPEAPDDGNQGPTARISHPTDGAAFIAGDPIVFEGTADDPEDGALDGRFLGWTSSRDGRFGIGRALAASDLSTGQHRITLTATDSDGATAEDEISVVVAENRSPSVTIAAPATGSVYVEGDVIRLEGSASDPEDGSLAGESLVWRSSQVGHIGTGESVELSQPSVGYHRIVLFAVDSRGACGWDDIFLEVEAAGAVTFAGHSVKLAVTPRRSGPSWSSSVSPGSLVLFQPCVDLDDVSFRIP